MLHHFWSKTPSIKLAVNSLHRGDVIAYPTEAVWGLGCDPFNGEAVNKILNLKQRPVDKGVILIAGSISQFSFILNKLSTKQKSMLIASWPGPVTWLVPHFNLIPNWISGEHDTVAIRVSKHPYVQALCLAYGSAIVSTSANPQGKPSATSQWKVSRYFKDNPNLSFITQGAVGARKQPSTIIDLDSGLTIR